jgi:hypothetical protein
MKSLLVGFACVFACCAQVPLECAVGNETVPAGQLVQLKLSLTDPRPISTGKLLMDPLDSALFGDILGIALFADAGDVAGAALVQGGQISARFTSPKATFGNTLDYP